MTATRSLPATRAYAEPGSRSAQLYEAAQRVLPGGSTRLTIYSPPYPPYAAFGEGAWLTDVDGDRRLDLLNNFTSLIHGHADPAVTQAAARRAARGAAFPMPTPEEIDLAALLVERLPGMAQVRFTNSGTEAVMLAVKAARAYTGRPKVAKFEGAYHGAYDFAEVSLGPSPAQWGPAEAPASVAYSKGTPKAVLDQVLVLPFNDAEVAARRIAEAGRDLACVLLDPVPNRAGLVPATPAFLEAVRETTRRHGVLLVFDEVITFRLGYHGAQGRFGVRPDLTTLGKIIGGGFPVGAVAGTAEVMAVFDARRGKPALPHGGTFNANPVTMAAGLAAMRRLDEAAFARLETLGDRLRAGVRARLAASGLPGGITGQGSLFRLHPSRRDFRDYRSAAWTPEEAPRAARLYRALLEHGVLVGQNGLGCLSTPMTEAEVDLFVDTLAACVAEAAGDGPAPTS